MRSPRNAPEGDLQVDVLVRRRGRFQGVVRDGSYWTAAAAVSAA